MLNWNITVLLYTNKTIGDRYQYVKPVQYVQTNE